MNYNPWPNGQVPLHLQRPELNQLKELGYKFDDAREVVEIFENKVAEFAGSKFAVACDCATHGLELAFRFDLSGESSFPLRRGQTICCPRNTYISAALLPITLGLKVIFESEPWSGVYQYGYTRIFDGAVRWSRGMYVGNRGIQVVSFQIKKKIPIGRGGMILTNDKDFADWARMARYDGRNMSLPYDHPEHVVMQGFHFYITPEDSARGIMLMDQIKEEGDTGDWTKYPDVLQYKNVFDVVNK